MGIYFGTHQYCGKKQWPRVLLQNMKIQLFNFNLNFFSLSYLMGIWFNIHQYCGKKNDTCHFYKKTKCI